MLPRWPGRPLKEKEIEHIWSHTLDELYFDKKIITYKDINFLSFLPYKTFDKIISKLEIEFKR